MQHRLQYLHQQASSVAICPFPDVQCEKLLCAAALLQESNLLFIRVDDHHDKTHSMLPCLSASRLCSSNKLLCLADPNSCCSLHQHCTLASLHCGCPVHVTAKPPNCVIHHLFGKQHADSRAILPQSLECVRLSSSPPCSMEQLRSPGIQDM